MALIGDLKIEDLESSRSVDASRATRSKHGGLNIVFTQKYGKRIGINQGKILDHLEDSTRIQFSCYRNRYLLVGSNISEENPFYSVRRNGKNGVIYNSELVKELIEYFNLDFRNRSSKTYPVIDIQETDKGNLVVIDMCPEEDHAESREQELYEETESVEIEEEE